MTFMAFDAIVLGIAVLLMGASLLLYWRAKKCALVTQKSLHDPVDQPSINFKDFGRELRKLAHRLNSGPERFDPDVLLGISGGGLAFADMISVSIYEHTREVKPVYPICVKKVYRKKQPPETTSDELRRLAHHKKVLLIEDFFLGGESLTRVIDQLVAANPKELRVMLFAVPPKYIGTDGTARLGDFHIQYFAVKCNTNQFTMPWGRT